MSKSAWKKYESNVKIVKIALGIYSNLCMYCLLVPHKSISDPRVGF